MLLLPNTKKKLKTFRKRRNEESKIDHSLIKEVAIREAFGSLRFSDDRQRALYLGFSSIYDWVRAGRP
jgi:hypothetical protein